MSAPSAVDLLIAGTVRIVHGGPDFPEWYVSCDLCCHSEPDPQAFPELYVTSRGELPAMSAMQAHLTRHCGADDAALALN